MKADKVDNYKDAASMKGLKFAAESGSAGESVAKDNGYDVTAVTAQSDALLEVKSRQLRRLRYRRNNGCSNDRRRNRLQQP